MLLKQIGLLVVGVVAVCGQAQSGRLDTLKGNQGEDACTLRDKVAGSCPPSQRRAILRAVIADRDVTSPVPTICSCNHIFFNIWSACSYASGNNTLPNYSQWVTTCEANTVDLASSLSYAEVAGNLDIDIPTWARIDVPGNTSFDVQKAVLLAQGTVTAKWTTVQIVLPIVAAVLTSFLMTFVLLVYQRRSSKGNILDWPSRGLRHLRLGSATKVQTVSKADTWVIDSREGYLGEPPVFMDPLPSPADTFRGHPQLVRFSPEFDSKEVQGHLPHQVGTQSSSSSNSRGEWHVPGSSALKSMHLGDRMRSVPVPWGRKPVPVRQVAAYNRFRIDENDKTTESSNRSTLTPSAEARSAASADGDNSRFSQISETSDHSELEYPTPEDDEETNLISQDEHDNGVFLISNGRRDFTVGSRSTNTSSINSHIKIISPSVSSASPRSSTARNTQMAGQPSPLRIPPPPPRPRQPAPLPPNVPRRIPPRQRGDDNELSVYSQPSLVPNRFMSPIHEMSSSSDLSLRRSPALLRQGSNDTMTTRSPPSSNEPLGYGHQRAASHSAASVVGDDVFYDIYGPNAHRRGLSADDAASFYLSPETPLQPVRSVTPARGDTVMLFPGSVRGAGYRIPGE
ncbi:hypothetical protein B0H34DRAFT_733603 [Crassisporium funariophilum]|nr:hypothetical protein B0H34DRAFT_733603 [Crassisporium funariophilum]